MNGCLCIHGFTGAPYEVAPLANYIKEHTDWEIAVPTLPGHGERQSLKGIVFQKWINHAEEELKNLLEKCEVVYIIGFSMGGMIASELAVKYPVAKLVLLSAAAYYLNPRQIFLDIKGLLREWLQGTRITQNPLFIHYKQKISSTPIAAARQFQKLVATVRPRLKEVKVPTFIAQGEDDGIVPVRSADYLYKHITSEQKHKIIIKRSKHLICHCDESEQLFKEVLQFLS